MFGDEGESGTGFLLHAFNHIPRVDLDPEEEKDRQAEDKEKFRPLLSWLKEQAQDVVRDG